MKNDQTCLASLGKMPENLVWAAKRSKYSSMEAPSVQVMLLMNTSYADQFLENMVFIPIQHGIHSALGNKKFSYIDLFAVLS